MVNDSEPRLPPYEEPAGAGADAETASIPPEGPSQGAAAVPAGENPEATRRERDEFRDLLLRQTAEFDNYRKRVERERREQAGLAAADVLTELLPLVDNLERALASIPEEGGVSAYKRGVRLIHKQLIELLARRGVTVIDPLGDLFDPTLHEAVTREPAAGRRDGEVVEVLGRGYRLGDRLLRAALVKVATA